MLPAVESSSCMTQASSSFSSFFFTVSLFSCFKFLLLGVFTGVRGSPASKLSPLIFFLTCNQQQFFLKISVIHLLLPLLALLDLHRVVTSMVDQSPCLHLFGSRFISIAIIHLLQPFQAGIRLHNIKIGDFNFLQISEE